MAGSSISGGEMRLVNNRLKIGLILLIGALAALVAVQAETILVQATVALLCGVVIGGLLMWYLRRWSREFTAVNRQ